jgi:hypothetical protein
MSRLTRENRLALRRGSVAAWFLVTLPALLLSGLLAINAAWLADARTSIQSSADASALAAVHTFVHDDWLREDESAPARLARESRSEAQKCGLRNPVLGCALGLERNDENAPEGDIVIGSLDHPKGKFVPAEPESDRHSLDRSINAVRIHPRKTKVRGNPVALLGSFPSSLRYRDLEASATAMLDGRIIGFRQRFSQPIPMAPIALFSDPEGRHERSWEHQVSHRKGQDEWTWSCSTKTFERRPDGLHEMRVELFRCPDDDSKPRRKGNAGQSGRVADAERPGDERDGESTTGGQSARKHSGEEAGHQRGNAFLCRFGSVSPADFHRQLVEGLLSEDLKEFGGEFVLAADQLLQVPGRGCLPEAGSEWRGAYLSGLEALARCGEPRVWPLYSRRVGNDGALISGFVAARVVRMDHSGDNVGVALILQPTRICTAAAVTAVDRELPESAVEVNPYIVKVRLVE